MLAMVSTLSARNLPSLSSASSAWVTWSRPWQSVMNDSERSAVHLIGRPTRDAAQQTMVSSA